MPTIFYRLYYLYCLVRSFDLINKIRRALPVLLLLTITAVSFRLLKIYLIWDINLWLSLILAPFILYIRKPVRHSIRFGILSLLTLIIYVFVPVLTLYYLAFCFAFCFVVECSLGKMNHATFLVILLMGSITRYFINIFGFSLRLKLSAASGWILNLLGYTNEVSGNIITHNDISFAIDPACLGLKMVITTFLITMVIATFFEKRSNTRLGIPGLLILCGVTALLIVFTNFIRIITLIMFKSSPESFSHEFIGIASMLIYSILPIYLIVPFIVSFTGKKINPYKGTHRISRRLLIIVSLPLIAGLLYFNISYKGQVTNVSNEFTAIELDGFNKEVTNNNVLKFSKENTLVYIKPPSRFYGSDHNPYICWQGSGYEFRNIDIMTVGDMEIYTSCLTKDNEVLYTSWWFDNGSETTVSQTEWRWQTMKGELPYYLINVTCSTKEELIKEVERVNCLMVELLDC